MSEKKWVEIASPIRSPLSSEAPTSSPTPSVPTRCRHFTEGRARWWRILWCLQASEGMVSSGLGGVAEVTSEGMVTGQWGQRVVAGDDRAVYALFGSGTSLF
jgi:hypothetical protein